MLLLMPLLILSVNYLCLAFYIFYLRCLCKTSKVTFSFKRGFVTVVFWKVLGKHKMSYLGPGPKTPDNIKACLCKTMNQLILQMFTLLNIMFQLLKTHKYPRFFFLHGHTNMDLFDMQHRVCVQSQVCVLNVKGVQVQHLIQHTIKNRQRE